MTEPKCRPILFSGPMVRAILEGRKTQTRRIVESNRDSERWADVQRCQHAEDAGDGFWGFTEEDGTGHCDSVRCPYGVIGDRLWVRETWRRNGDAFEYWADLHDGLEKRMGDAKWKPSIHMPRAASRITLEITGARVERLQSSASPTARPRGFIRRIPTTVCGTTRMATATCGRS